ncbi:phytanoyl-CoA dioxygenase family protein [Chryseolinea sp. H1M3-3]|uniref:phytanoyl-CoA dioxygenase family protein n=1 Tax=Chryseolinea sp. H1M3-3 TaxID=3034144 RepID=UPI0023EC8F6E|nr:phytanoyl-CoA dioxygenase family protein [Chryseolinea sp. H1M3-3]
MNVKQDLSEHHQLVGDLFPEISPKEAWERYKLTDEQVSFFNTYGFLAGVKLLDDHQVDELLKELDEIKEPSHPKHHLFYEFHTNESKDPSAVLFHSLGHWRITPGFHDILWNPAFVVAASQLLGNKPVRFWHDQLFCKPAHHGGVVAWHQDYSYWQRTLPMQHLTCWVGLDDVTKENGCLYYVPKSHTWGLLDKPELAGDMDGLQRFLTDEQKKQFAEKVPIEMKRGYATFHHPLMVHGSYENKSSRPRRAFVLNVFADGTYSDSDGEILAGVPIIQKGKQLKGQFFPLLFDPAEMHR